MDGINQLNLHLRKKLLILNRDIFKLFTMTPTLNNVAYLSKDEVSTSPDTIRTKEPSFCTNDVVAIPTIWRLGTECAKVSEGYNKKTSLYTRSGCFTSRYLASIFNSYLGLFFLLGGAVRKMQTVRTNKEEVMQVPIFKTNLQQQGRLGDLQMIIQGLYEDYNNSHTRVMIDMFENVRDGMVLELYFQKEFKQRGISLWKSWDDTIKKNSFTVDFSNASEIYSSIRGLSSPVRNSLKSIQILKNSPDFKF